MGLPLRHRLDHVMVYVSAIDDAWDYEKIGRESLMIAGAVEPEEGEVVPWATEADHPVTRYMSGASRYDLSTVREYLREGVEPIEFELRRVNLRQWSAIADCLERGKFFDARLHAIRMSLVCIRGAGITFDRKKQSDALSDEDLDMLRLTIGENEFRSLGFACLQANASLSSDEKKL